MCPVSSIKVTSYIAAHLRVYDTLSLPAAYMLAIVQ